MLTLDREQTTALDYSVVNASIQETFTAIDRFEWQASDELRLMRDKGYYQDGGHKSFEAYCEKELTKHGGYRRVRDLLSAKKVVDTLPEELREKITKPSQTRPLLRLVKTPDKLQEVVAIASQEKPFPTAADFALAVQKVVPKNTSPTRTSSTKQEKVKTQLCNFVTVSSLSHPKYGESGVIEADAPNNYQQIVTFSDGERLLVNNSDLADSNDAIVSESSGRTYPKEYSEAIAAIEEQHKQELERLSQELRIGLQAEAGAKAEAQVQEQIQSLQNLYKQQKEENIQLQQRLSEMEGLRKLEIENQQLQQRIQDLENAVEERPSQQWGNTMTQQATKALKVLAKPGCTWQEFWAVAQEYEVIKQDYWAELTTEETELIVALEIASHPPVIQVGSIVAYADPYYTLYNARGEVVEDLGEGEVLVAWDHWKDEGRKTSRYFLNELRFWQPQ